jgi:hypothetical protein
MTDSEFTNDVNFRADSSSKQLIPRNLEILSQISFKTEVLVRFRPFLMWF